MDIQVTKNICLVYNVSNLEMRIFTEATSNEVIFPKFSPKRFH